jgi:hypothetical protein
MSTVERFLEAVDLDDLLRARDEISTLSLEERSRVEQILNAWTDHQAVSNLLFHPTVIPDELRFAAIDRGMHSYDASYLALAATVGLQSIEPCSVADEFRERWRRSLVSMMQSNESVLAGRASVTAFSWFKDHAVELFSLYPVADQTACRNILAFALAAFGDLDRHEFASQIRSCGVPPDAMTDFTDVHDEYWQKKNRGIAGVGFMKLPIYCYIPNLAQCAVDSTEAGRPRQFATSFVRDGQSGFLPFRFLEIQHDLQPKVQFALAAIPCAMLFVSIFPLRYLSAWLATLFGIPPEVGIYGSRHGSLYFAVFLVSMLVHMFVGYLVGWFINAIVLWMFYGWSFERIRRLVFHSALPNEWYKS